MSSSANNHPANFLTHIIDQDLSEGIIKFPITRFPPEPSGYLHIGHVKSICLNFGIKEDYHGQCHLRFDDTNPANEELDYVTSIQDDIKWLGFEWDGEIRYASSYFELFYSYAQELIKQNLAYVDFSTPEQIREMRGDFKTPGTESPYRNQSVEEAMQFFAKMRAGEYQEGQACLRAKIDMASSFIVMRDPVIYRIKDQTHHQTGDSWKIYPMYDFAHCISDALENISHSLCTLEFQDNRRLYDWFLEHLTTPGNPHQYEFSRLNLQGSLTSKRKITKLVEANMVDGWDDPRLHTVAGLRRRGYTPQSLREFCKRIGVTKQENLIEQSALEACIRDDLNNVAYRAMVVKDPVKLVFTNLDQDLELSFANHPQNPEYGQRQVIFSKEIYIERSDFALEASKDFKRLVLGGEVRLRHSYIIKAEAVDYDEQGQISTIYAVIDPDTLGKKPADGRKVKGVIHWVSASHAVPITLMEYGNLFSVDNPGELEDIVAAVNPHSVTQIKGFAEASLKDSKPGQAFQFERLGYYVKDLKATDEQLIFNLTVSLKEGF